jgi:endonuclease/exonuclease/phosphatase family metal-dependent hydrolase
MQLSVLTLNIMHGRNRRSALWPPAVGVQEVRANLKKIAEFIERLSPDFVALQEVDEYSVLSGGFNHYEFLQEHTGYAHGFFAPSCRVRGVFVSGQAILSKYPLSNCAAHRFPVTFPTDRMGFVAADAAVPDGTVTVASVHLVYLDWLRRDPRAQELRLLEAALVGRSTRQIIAGDFNQDMSGRGAPALPTHPSWAPTRRIDWILLKNLAYEHYEVPQEHLSDHLPVIARCR